MTTLPQLQKRTLQAISEKSKKTLPDIAIRSLLDKGLIAYPHVGDTGYQVTEDGEKALKNEV
jgi:hypothetical protein